MTLLVEYEVGKVLMEGPLRVEDLSGPGEIVGNHIQLDKAGIDEDVDCDYHRE